MSDKPCPTCGGTVNKAKAQALREFADAHRMPFTMFRRADDSKVTVSDLLREQARRLEETGQLEDIYAATPSEEAENDE